MTLDIVKFRELFPAFADEAIYPDSLLTALYELGQCYIASCATANAVCSEYAHMLMLAHLLAVRTDESSGSSGKQISQATEGNVSVSFANNEANSKSSFAYWLNNSGYGIELLALLEATSSAFYTAGSYVTSDIKNDCGYYGYC